jgi:hypothetical protein
MKAIRTYPSGCRHCKATGFVPTTGTSSSTTDRCPVCNGSKVITVTEEFEMPFIIPAADSNLVIAEANPGIQEHVYVSPENRRYLCMPNADGSYSVTIPAMTDISLKNINPNS